MENPAATGLKSKIKRHASNRGLSPSRSHSMPTEGNGSFRPNEHTSLLARTDSTPLYEDSRPWVRWPMYTYHVTKKTLLSNYVNVLLVFVPLGIIAGAMGWSPTAVFILNFLAIIPLAALLSFATEELSVKLGQTLGGLLNATFGNAVELIVSGSFTLQTAYLLTPNLTHVGQYCGAQEWRDPNCPVQHAGQYLIEHSPRTRLLLPSRRHQVS